MRLKSRKYRDRDFEAILSWYESRRMRPDKGLLPQTGFIVPGVAAGFLINTDTSMCILEPFIANPEASKAIRDEALSRLMIDLVEEAKRMGYKRVFGFSSNEPMIARALSCGFTVVEESTTVCKELT